MKNLKIISTILLSIMLIFVSTTIFAADANVENDDFWSTPSVEDNNTVDQNTTGTNDLEDPYNNVYEENNTVDYNDVEDNTEYSYNDTENNSTTSDNSLAYTGIGDSNGMIALIVIVSAVVAIYSAKKYSDYKNL